jgi:hypothetical protein
MCRRWRLLCTPAADPGVAAIRVQSKRVPRCRLPRRGRGERDQRRTGEAAGAAVRTTADAAVAHIWLWNWLFEAAHAGRGPYPKSSIVFVAGMAVCVAAPRPD